MQWGVMLRNVRRAPVRSGCRSTPSPIRLRRSTRWTCVGRRHRGPGGLWRGHGLQRLFGAGHHELPRPAVLLEEARRVRHWRPGAHVLREHVRLPPALQVDVPGAWHRWRVAHPLRRWSRQVHRRRQALARARAHPHSAGRDGSHRFTPAKGRPTLCQTSGSGAARHWARKGRLCCPGVVRGKWLWIAYTPPRVAAGPKATVVPQATALRTCLRPAASAALATRYRGSPSRWQRREGVAWAQGATRCFFRPWDVRRVHRTPRLTLATPGRGQPPCFLVCHHDSVHHPGQVGQCCCPPNI
jgi:hypothetical protein